MQVHAVHRHPEDALALAVMVSDDGHALVYLSLSGDTPVPIEVTVKATKPPSARRCKEMLSEYKATGLQPVSTSLIRSLSLSSALSALREDDGSRLRRVKDLEAEARGGVPESFRTARDYGAARERVLVAAAYVDRVQAGDPTPAQSLAEAFNKSKSWVNKRLAAARAAGYLTSLGHGRAGGDLTDAAWDVLLGAEEPGEDLEESDWDDEEMSDGDIEEYETSAALDALFAEEEEDVETYGGWVLCHGCLTPYEYIDSRSVCPECG